MEMAIKLGSQIFWRGQSLRFIYMYTSQGIKYYFWLNIQSNFQNSSFKWDSNFKTKVLVNESPLCQN